MHKFRGRNKNKTKIRKLKKSKNIRKSKNQKNVGYEMFLREMFWEVI